MNELLREPPAQHGYVHAYEWAAARRRVLSRLARATVAGRLEDRKLMLEALEILDSVRPGQENQELPLTALGRAG